MLRSAAIALESGLMAKDEILALYEDTAQASASTRPKTPTAGRASKPWNDVMAPLAPYTPDKVHGRSHARADPRRRRIKAFGSEDKLPEKQVPKHLAIQINQALHDLFAKYPETLLFGEDVAQKGGVYTVTKGLHKAFGNRRVFNTLLDETMILGMAQGFANMGMLPIPEIQYLAYLHNAIDQTPRRGGAACSSSATTSTATRWSCASPALVTSAASAGISTTTTRSPRCATSPAWWSAAPRVATMRR